MPGPCKRMRRAHRRHGASPAPRPPVIPATRGAHRRPPPATRRDRVPRRGLALVGLALEALLLAGCAGQGTGERRPQAGGPSPDYREKLFYELGGMPGSGTLKVYDSGRNTDVEFALFRQRVRWSGADGADTLASIGWADYRGRCERRTVWRGRQPEREFTSCSAPFRLFIPLPGPSGEPSCFDGVELVRPICPEAGRTHDLLERAAALGQRLLRHAAARPRRSFRPFTKALAALFDEFRDLPGLLEAHRAGSPERAR